MASLTTVTMGMLTPTPMDTTTARDLLMLSPLLRLLLSPLLMPTTVTTVMALPTTGKRIFLIFLIKFKQHLYFQI